MKSGRKNKSTPGFGEDVHLLSGLKLLADSGARYLIVGGVACNLHGLVRATKDIDVLIPKDIENAEKILKSLEGLLWGISREILPEEVVSKPFTIIGDTPRVDLLLCAGKITFEKAYPHRVERVIEGIKVSYVSVEDLILSKDTSRPRDQLEIEEIKRLQRLKEDE